MVCGREKADGLYTPLCYLTARMTEEVVIAFVNAAAFSTLAFFPVFLSGSYVPFFMAKFITTSIGIVLGYLVAAISPTMEIANSVLTILQKVIWVLRGLNVQVSSHCRFLA